MPSQGLVRCLKLCSAWALAVFSFAWPAAVAQQEDWSWSQRGPAGKDLNAVHFTDSKRGWIAGDGGFVGATKNGGETWSIQKVNTQEPINRVI
ncbi:MAG: hypothetical protein WKF84_17565 [Pyrinomonadaceae bacterium]